MTNAEMIATYRRFATAAAGLAGEHWMTCAQLAAESLPFHFLVIDIDAFFGSELEAALSGSEAEHAEREVRRITAKHLARAQARLALSAVALNGCAPSNVSALYNMATVALQRAADLRFVEVISRTR